MSVRLFQVGGCVRDSFLGVKSTDLDFAVEAPSYETMKAEILRRGGIIFIEKPEFLTVRAHVPKLGAADFVLCRKDGQYTDGRRPDEVIPGTLLDDLSRRDFCMNAIAQGEDGEIIDPFDGRGDIQKGVIRCVGKAFERFQEDSLRLLRAIRFSITKRFLLSQEVIDCLWDNRLVGLLKNVSQDRIREELHKAFYHDTPGTLRLLSIYSLLPPALFGSGIWLKPTSEQ